MGAMQAGLLRLTACALFFAVVACGPRAEPGLEPPDYVHDRADGGPRSPGTGANAGNSGNPSTPTGTAGSGATKPPRQDGGAMMNPDEGTDTEDGGTDDAGPLPTIPVPPPEKLNCITDVSAGLHSFECDGITHDLNVPEACLTMQCGLVIDVHGGTMSSRMENNNTDMQRIGGEH